MIKYPIDWNIDYTEYMRYSLVGMLRSILKGIDCANLAYSGGIDSTVLLHLLAEVKDKVKTYTIVSRHNHPDARYARMGSEAYGTEHTEFVTDIKDGDDAVKKLFELSKVDSMICGDGIDEFTAGYYDHEGKYEKYLSELTKNHLIPLNENSGEAEVYLPYLNHWLLMYLSAIPLGMKYRKKIVVNMARELEIPIPIIERKKYGFCDAGLKEDK